MHCSCQSGQGWLKPRFCGSRKTGTPKFVSLTEVEIRTAKGKAKAYKLYDEKGLFLLVKSAGRKLWRFKYRFDRAEKLLALGRYPDVSLKLARSRRDEARRLVAEGVDPSATRKAAQDSTADTFSAIAQEWLLTKRRLSPRARGSAITISS